ncbi:MAG: hypothetical protein BM557_09175 [Flavobacterium sp. MedPE-SWcel]|uniref:SH3 domain-containing protein n=1 Tax=uncultured Flavobacterium sp. TaxID=165435 RepID=UPI00091177EF|nr:SH3 domain-containing protein [uncultured Flavobacterium sp.]OIQ16911.1 MAG: hypothetical protein BM557_09175 [Flavobacterium sp. MedPE-SWcel]
MKKYILIFILFTVYFSNAQTCRGDYPVYYSKGLVYIYQNMSSDSAIKGEIPNGEKVKIISSNYGNVTGFWKVCYNGKNGYAKKNKLSYKKIEKSNTHTSKKNISKLNNQDVGFNPFIGKTTSAVNFRKGPSSEYEIIKLFTKNSIVFVYSKNTINNYYKIIDVETSSIGWVHKSYVKYFQKADINENGAFTNTGYSSTYESEIKIKNKSSSIIKLIIGNETFSLQPESTRTVNIKPGVKHYIASAPGVIPASGEEHFKPNNGYEWVFWIETERY